MIAHACLLISCCLPALADDPQAQSIAPFVDENVVAIVHLDLARLDVEGLIRNVLGEIARDVPGVARHWAEIYREAGIDDLFILVDLADLPGPPVAVVPLRAGVDAEAIRRALCGGEGDKPLLAWPGSATTAGKHAAVIAGTKKAMARVQNAQPADRPELARAFEAVGGAPAQLLLLPTAAVRRSFDEMVPTLPAELGGGAITTVSQGLRWAALALQTEPKPALRLIVQARDADAAKALEQLGRNALELAGKQPALTDVVKEIKQSPTEIQGDRITTHLGLDHTSALVRVLLLQARAAAQRAQCMNNLKQIMLAMHNYLDQHKSFPPAASLDQEDRPLLSWRVLILPLLDQQALYNEFHLDEPWDSPHNKALIERMPPAYACSSADPKLAKAGKTTYLVPRGPTTIFPDGQGIKINEITDGTSNTIAIVDANDDHAVIWTQPEDWEITSEPKPDALLGHHHDGFNAAFADGSVRFIKAAIDPLVLHALLSRAGGEVIPSNAY